MKTLRFNSTAVWRRLRCLVRPFFPEITRHLEIKEQMDFWHEQERVTMKNAFDCLRAGDGEGYERWRNAHNVAHHRCNEEVRKPLGTLRTNSREMPPRQRLASSNLSTTNNNQQ